MKFVSGEFVSSSVSRIPVSAASSELALSGFKVLKRRRKNWLKFVVKVFLRRFSLLTFSVVNLVSIVGWAAVFLYVYLL